MKKRYLEAAKIVAVHALKGEVKAEVWCDSAEFLRRFEVLYLDEGGEKPLMVEHLRDHKGMAIILFNGVTSPEQAVAMRGQMLYFDREQAGLEPGVHFICDLVGLPVMDADSGRIYGLIEDVTNRGASDLYVISTPSGQVMLPAVEEFVVRVDDAGVFVRPIPGFFDGEDDAGAV